MKNIEILKPIEAHLKVISEAIIFARYLCEQKDNLLQVMDLLDAVHNTGQFIQKPFCKNNEYIALYYEPYDKKWKTSGLSLIDIYKSCDPECTDFLV